jgi:hypothetical protein
LAALPMSYSLPSHIADQVKLSALQPAILRLKALARADIESCLSDNIPDEWAISAEDRQAAVDHVILTQGQIEDIIRSGNPNLS